MQDDDTIPLFIAGSADGAIPNETRIAKVGTEEGDAHKDGATGKILSSHGPIPAGKGILSGQYGYFVEWDDMPGLPVFVVGFRIKELK